MRDYLEAITLGASLSKDNAPQFLALLEKMKTRTIVLQLLMVTLALNFPIMFNIARLSPYQIFSSLYAENFVPSLSDDLRLRIEANTDSDGLTIDETIHEQIVEDFNTAMLDFGKISTALMGMGFFLVIVLQIAFYLTVAFCMGLQRPLIAPLAFRSRVGILAFSSTLPVFAASLMGLWMPILHILVFYFAVLLIGFRRNRQHLSGV
ncbi:MAG: hypothetical protein LBK25_08130 [Treponema sp.]|jgi:hypothetical protein|nr:hypothetical protein [Treponema sp.]